MIAWCGKVGNEMHMQVTGGLCSLAGRVRIDGQLVIGLYGSSVKVRSIEAATLLGRSDDDQGGKCGVG